MKLPFKIPVSLRRRLKSLPFKVPKSVLWEYAYLSGFTSVPPPGFVLQKATESEILQGKVVMGREYPIRSAASGMQTGSPIGS